jgi:energy-coupling factor transporter ATP-binding protein EcfA2
VIVGLTGKAGSGKDTVAGMLNAIIFDEYGHLSVRPSASLAFADPMKKFCAEVFDFSEEQLYGKLKEEPDLRYPRTHVEPGTGCAYRTHLTPRYALQTLGTQWGRDCYPNIWVEYGIRRAQEFLKVGAKLVTITDVRFENEADAVHEAGGKILRVVRPGAATVGIAGHKSETEMDGITADFEILNDGTLVDLREKVRAAWQFFQGEK